MLTYVINWRATQRHLLMNTRTDTFARDADVCSRDVTIYRDTRECACHLNEYTCERCGPAFSRRDSLTRHVTRSNDGEPPVPKRSKLTTERIPLMKDTVLPPSRLPFSDDISSDLQDVVSEHWSITHPAVVRGPANQVQSPTTLDTNELRDSLIRMFQERTTAFKINLS